MIPLVVTLLVFVAVGVVFLAANLVLGRLVRPDKPSPEKGQVYECGEEPVGTARVQFDLRFYVVALLFVIFDVELAFFFPWAVVFGTANQLADASKPEADRAALVQQLTPGVTAVPDPESAQLFAGWAFAEMLAFFAVLLLGFAYLWHRGDLEWVMSTAGQEDGRSPRAAARGAEAAS